MATDLLLCNPYLIKDDPVTRDAMDIYPLLGHGYLASYLNSHGYSAEIFDATFERGFEAYFEALAATRPEVVGLYDHLLSRDNAFSFARAARERGQLVIAGGPDATGYYDDYLSNGFDIVVRSEGEETAREVMEWAASGSGRAELHKILGIAFRTDDGNVVLNGARPWTPKRVWPSAPGDRVHAGSLLSGSDRVPWPGLKGPERTGNTPAALSKLAQSLAGW